MNTRRIKELIIIATILITYNVLVFVIPFKKNAVFAVSYIFTMIAIFGFAVSYWVAFDKAETLREKFLSFPIFRFGVIYLIVQLCCASFFMKLNIFINIPVWIVVLPYVVILAIAIIKVLIIDIARDRIASVATKEEINTRFITLFQIDIKTLSDRAKDEKVQERLLKFAEMVRFSDPVSIEQVREIEANMAKVFNDMNTLIRNGNNDVDEMINELEILLAERNAKCKALRK